MGHDRLVRALLAGVAACTAVPQAASEPTIQVGL